MLLRFFFSFSEEEVDFGGAPQDGMAASHGRHKSSYPRMLPAKDNECGKQAKQLPSIALLSTAFLTIFNL